MRAKTPGPDWEALALRLASLRTIVQQQLQKTSVQELPSDWAERISGRTLDAWQRDVMNSTSPQLLLNCSRQVGKTEVVSLRAAYEASVNGKRVVALAPTLFQSSKVRTRSEAFLRNTGIERFTEANATTLGLPNGGAVLSLPGDRPDLSVRGETVDVLIVDEASRVKDSLIAAATPTTATKKDAIIIYLSTPAGQQGEFYKAWSEPGDSWEKHSITAEMCPRIAASFLARELKRLGPTLYSQEYQCQFVANSTAVLDPDALMAMFRSAPEVSSVVASEVLLRTTKEPVDPAEQVKWNSMGELTKVAETSQS